MKILERKGNQALFVLLKWSLSHTKEYIMDLNDNNKYNVILCEESSFLLYRQG